MSRKTTADDERRRVAERLRKASAHGQGISCGAVDKALGLRYDDDYFGGVFECESVLRLADLIDPTCHLGPTYDGGFGCDRCYTWFPEMKAKASYCPACGARVVDDE